MQSKYTDISHCHKILNGTITAITVVLHGTWGICVILWFNPHSLLTFMHTESIFSLNNLWNSMILQQSSFSLVIFFSISWHVILVVDYCHTQAPTIMLYREMQWLNWVKEGRMERRMHFFCASDSVYWMTKWCLFFH